MSSRSASYATILALFFSLLFPGLAQAEEFLYKVICHPTQHEDIARVIRGRIYLALKNDSSVEESSIYVSVQKTESPEEWLTETELLAGFPFMFNSSDLSLSIGSDVVSHACFAEAELTARINVTRTDGSQESNDFTAPIRVPGAYATKTKIRVPTE